MVHNRDVSLLKLIASFLHSVNVSRILAKYLLRWSIEKGKKKEISMITLSFEMNY